VGGLSLQAAKVVGNGGRAFSGYQLEVHQVMDWRGLTAEGDVRLVGAHIGGQLVFGGATLHQALMAEGLHVDQDMFCDEGFTADGEVSLAAAHVGVAGWYSEGQHSTRV
jgi:hypothetical protein